MANLSNINNKFIVTSETEALIGATSWAGVGSGTLAAGLVISGNTSQFILDNPNYNHFTMYSASDSNIYNIFGSSGNYLIGTGNKDTSSWSEKMRIGSDGTVDINLNQRILDGFLNMNKSDGTYIKFDYNNAVRGYIGSERQLFSGGSEANMGYLATGDSVFGAGGAERMRIDSSGNVLIGTAIDAGKVTIQNDTANAYALRVLRSTSTTQGLGGFYEGASNEGILYLVDGSNGLNAKLSSSGDSYFNGGNVGIGTTSPSSYTYGSNLAIVDTGSVGITIQSNTTGASAIQFADGVSGAAQYRGGIDYYHSANSSGAAYYSRMDFRTNGAARITILGNGNVGIGTSGPVVNLQVQAAGSPTIAMSTEGPITSGTRGNLAWYNNSTSTVANIRADTDTSAAADTVGTDLAFFTRAIGGSLTQKMVIKGGGNVGIGYTSPSKALSVNGGMYVGGNNTDAGATGIYGDIRRPQAVNYCERIWNRNSAATPSLYYVARQWHDSINWAAGHINVIVWGVAPTLSTLFKGDFSCGYGYAGNSVHISTNFNPGNLTAPVWQAPVLVSGNIYYRDLTITPPSYNRYIVQVINPGNLVQTYDINNTGQNKVYFYPQG